MSMGQGRPSHDLVLQRPRLHTPRRERVEHRRTQRVLQENADLKCTMVGLPQNVVSWDGQLECHLLGWRPSVLVEDVAPTHFGHGR